MALGGAVNNHFVLRYSISLRHPPVSTFICAQAKQIRLFTLWSLYICTRWSVARRSTLGPTTGTPRRSSTAIASLYKSQRLSSRSRGASNSPTTAETASVCCVKTCSRNSWSHGCSGSSRQASSSTSPPPHHVQPRNEHETPGSLPPHAASVHAFDASIPSVGIVGRSRSKPATRFAA